MASSDDELAIEPMPDWNDSALGTIDFGYDW